MEYIYFLLLLVAAGLVVYWLMHAGEVRSLKSLVRDDSYRVTVVGHSIKYVSLHVASTTLAEFTLAIPRGLVFGAPAGSGVQNMVCVENTTIRVPERGVIAKVPVSCVNMRLQIPSKETSLELKLGEPCAPTLAKLLAFFERKANSISKEYVSLLKVGDSLAGPAGGIDVERLFLATMLFKTGPGLEESLATELEKFALGRIPDIRQVAVWIITDNPARAVLLNSLYSEVANQRIRVVSDKIIDVAMSSIVRAGIATDSYVVFSAGGERPT